MRRRPRALAYAAALGALVTSTARADHDTTVPADMEHVEVEDVTLTMRDDSFNVLEPDPVDPNTVFVGTKQGRIYKTEDAGKTWTESTVIPEKRSLWASAGTTIFFGGIRSEGAYHTAPDVPNPSALELPGHVPAVYGGLNPPDEVPLSTGGSLRYGVESPTENPLERESAIASGAGGGFLGIGLSSRAPRLSILTGSRGRPVPVLNRQRLLGDRVLSGTSIWKIAVDPKNRNLVYAATNNGLYQSFDAGKSWVRTFGGLTPAERFNLTVVIRPSDRLMLLGTGNGAYVSIDHGDNWAKITTVGGYVNDIAFDATDDHFVYLATSGGVLRSTDGAASFQPVYYSTFPAENDVRSVSIDPFDPETVYIGTNRGAFLSHNARAPFPQWSLIPGMQGILQVQRIAACSKHKGHLYAMTRMELATINYGAPAPENAVIETFDAGTTWRQIFTGQTDLSLEWFGLDTQNPDEMWIAWTPSIHHLKRVSEVKAPAHVKLQLDDETRPSISEITLAALKYQGVEMEDYTEKLSKARSHWLPSSFTIRGLYRRFSTGGIQDDAQFAPGRYLEVQDFSYWQITAVASWSLPDTIYHFDAIPMLKLRVQVVNDELRHRILDTVEKSYAESLRIRAALATADLDLKTRVIYQLRIEQLEAMVDLASGGYLTRWQKKHGRTIR
jgi:hypothetical protein